MQVTIADTRADLTLEGHPLDVLLDLADSNLATLDYSLVKELKKLEGLHLQTHGFPPSSGIETKHYLAPSNLHFVVVLATLDSGHIQTRIVHSTDTFYYNRLMGDIVKNGTIRKGDFDSSIIGETI